MERWAGGSLANWFHRERVDRLGQPLLKSPVASWIRDSLMAANSIAISLDKATFESWQTAFENLLVPRVVSVIPVGDFEIASELPTEVRFTGIRLLLQIGRACSRPEIMEDPSRLFALLKYATALSPGTPVLSGGGIRDLSLAFEIETLDSHKKAVLSDEFGCGMAFEISGQALGTHFYLDVETALREKWIQTSSTRNQRPDYFALTLSGPVPWVVLEAKGSQSGNGYSSRRQIPKGCQQLSRVALVNTGAAEPIRVVVATSLSRHGSRHPTRVFVGDPEPNFPEPYVFSKDAVETVVRSHYRRISVLTGDTRLANSLMGVKARPAGDEDSLILEKIGGRKFAGSRVTFNNAESSIESFVGLDISIREALLDGHFRPISEGLRTLALPNSQDEGDTPDSAKAGLIAVEMENDGSVLIVKRRWNAADQVKRK